ncbi:NAD(P)-dependent oxidoreductase [Weissella sp. LMG 11983]|uniref:NAD(P)-dependent oxidoreductase n=1 Tax=Weissella sp. LMG 11983 TaxID=2987700 RepID=UPI0029CA5578|nr:NAD(P)-dependent oxidoreductase [Weissella sp. LMG 11983]
MAFKIAVFGVRDNEVPYFHDLNKYNYDLTLVPENLSLANVDKVDGHDAVLARANCALHADMLQKLSAHGIKYVFTRTVGHSHIDLHFAKEYGLTVAYVPSYSPYAVAELAFTLALMQQRQTTLAVANAAKGQFQVLPQMFATELHNLTVGIIGTGRIGQAEAELWRGVGATVLGYDVYQNDKAKELLTYVSEDELLVKSDIVSLHVPHFPGKNDFILQRSIRCEDEGRRCVGQHGACRNHQSGCNPGCR